MCDECRWVMVGVRVQVGERVESEEGEGDKASRQREGAKEAASANVCTARNGTVEMILWRRLLHCAGMTTGNYL